MGIGLCPACGSNEVVTEKIQRTYTPPFGKTELIESSINTCLVCKESGYFNIEGSVPVQRAIEKVDRESIAVILDSLAKMEISMAYMERVLGLPQRTLARWKAGECSSGGIALMRIIRTYPWILDVASNKFSHRVAQQAIIRVASDTLREHAKDHGIDY